MQKIMLAPFGAPPVRNERICYFQVEIMDANETRIGVIGTDAMALALQELGFAVLDTKKEKDLSFGQAMFLMKQGKLVRRSSWDKDFVWGFLPSENSDKPLFAGPQETIVAGNNGRNAVYWEDVLASDWELVKD